MHGLAQNNGAIGSEGRLGGEAEDLDGQVGFAHATGVRNIGGNGEGTIVRVGVNRRGRIQTASVARPAEIPGVSKVGRRALGGGRKVHGVPEFYRAIARQGDRGSDATGDDAEGVG